MSKFEKEQVFHYPKVLIAGKGLIGNVMCKEFPFAETYDPDPDQKANHVIPPRTYYDYCFICVPTPQNKDGSCDTKYVEQVLEQVEADEYIIRSTVPPGTTRRLRRKCSFLKNIVFIPEFEGTTQHVTHKEWIAIGCDRDYDYHKVRQLYELVHNGYFEFIKTTSKEAEIAKYAENSFLAMKVIFCNELADLCKKEGVLYEQVRDIFTKDERIGRSHTFVYDDYPGYDSKCFNKDLPAILFHAKEKGSLLSLIEQTVKANKRIRSK